MKGGKSIRFSVLFVLAITVLGTGVSFINSVKVSAASNPAAGHVWSGRNWAWNGSGTEYYANSYFENQRLWSMEGRHGYYSSVIPTSNLYRSGSDAIPSHINTVNELVNHLKSLNRTGGSSLSANWKRTGSAFVVHSMLGRNGNQANSNGGRHISDAMFEDLRSRLNAARSINWSTIVSSDGVNTQAGAVGSNNADVQAVRFSKSDRAISITDSQGAVYKLFRKCANPVGKINGLSSLSFDLTPTINVSPTSSESTTRVNPTGSVNNSGATTSSSAQWQMTTFHLNQGVAIPRASGGVSGSAPVSFYGNGATITQSGNRAFARGATTISLNAQTLGSYPVGDKVCFTLSVQPHRHDNTNWRHSAPICVTISKTPKVQVLGGDLVVGRASTNNPSRVSNVETAISRMSSGLHYGSWSEYAIIPTGIVTGMASSSGWAGGSSAATLCGVSHLTFTNSGSSTCNTSAIGNYNHGAATPNIAARFPVTATTPRLSGTANIVGSSLSGLYTSTNATLTVAGGGQVPAGRWVVINAPNTTVTIGSNITYTTDTMNSIDDIPQVVIIARNIIISDAVENIDAWLIATGSGTNGRINTCGAGGVGESTQLNSEICNDKLTVNGPVSANHLLLRRTAGAGPNAASGDPAEVFNLRADAYIWASNYSSGAGRLPTITTTELPPRF